MIAQQKQAHRNLIKDYNIRFDGLTSRAEWPAEHSQTFSNIKKLGLKEFDHYCESVTIDSEDNPWRGQTKHRAERIASLAKICREGRKNEAGWRLSLESEILARFTVEVACRRCRARLWRSELEVAKMPLDRFSESLKERQEKRVPCTCRPGRRGVEMTEQGVNMLFDDRAEETIVQDIDLQSAMQKKEKPDRIYGLRMTKRLERLLRWTEDKRATSGGGMIGDSIRSTPFRPDGEPIVFPFLALEAKSEKSSDGFSNIETQTAFTIRSLLQLQEDLRKATGEDSLWESGPLVWFLANRGEEWRVAVAYVQYLNGDRYYRIVDLWDGRITSNDGALQLLLIVDYIFDWARDIYREAIINELRQLASNNTTSLGNDSDVFSLQDRIAYWSQPAQVQEQISDEESEFSKSSEPSTAIKQDPFKNFDSPCGVLRDATYIRSRFIALHITEDNISLLMESMKTQDKARKTAENILKCLRDSWRVSLKALDSLELMWTGKDRENMSLYTPHKVFFVTVTLSAYLSPDWEQTRELCYLAVSEDSVKELLQYANLKSNHPLLPTDRPWVEDKIFCLSFEMCKSISVEDNLLASISRASVSTKLYTEKTKSKTNEGSERGTWWVKSAEKVNGNTVYRFDTAIMPDPFASSRGLVSSIYNLHKIGRNEPSSSLLRISNRLDKQKRPTESALEAMWPSLEAKDVLTDRENNLIFVTSKNPSNLPNYAELCLFLLDALRVNELVDQDIQGQSRSTVQFQAMRMDTKPGWGGGWNRTNIQAYDDAFEDNKRKLLGHLTDLEKFTKYGEGKTLERLKPAKVWKPKKKYTNMVMAMSEPQSFDDVLKFRQYMAQKGRRLTSVIELQKSYSQKELHEIAGLPNIPESGARATSNMPSTTNSTRDNPPDAQDYNRRLDKEAKGKGPAISSPTKTPTLVLRDHVSKRKLDDSDPDMASSSAGPSKRPRQEKQANFDSDYLDDEQLSFLLENGGFKGAV